VQHYKKKLIEELTTALREIPTFIEKWRTSEQVSKNEMICWFYFTADVKIIALKIVTGSVHWFWNN
jgi:hypothetical protein